MPSASLTDKTNALIAMLSKMARSDDAVTGGRSEATDRLRAAIADLAEQLRLQAEDVDYLRFSIDQAPDGVFWMAEDGGFSYVNHQACLSLGYEPEELRQLRIWDIDPDFSREHWAEQWRRVRAAGRLRFETRHRRKDGSVFPVEISANFVRLGSREHHVAFARDISDRTLAEEERTSLSAQLQHAQKMESVGRLAGGVAHDFNNLLSVILSYASILLTESEPNAYGREELEEIKHAAERAATLTRQLLAFSRQQVLDFKPLDVNDIVSNVSALLRRLLGEDIELELRLSPFLWRVRADRGQLEQVLMNLAVNARDAMPRGGRLVIETANVDGEDRGASGFASAIGGPSVRVAVRDTGVGMDEETKARAFEPFFTTKDHGKGTGLGLSTVYGIVKQSGGVVSLISEMGRGTTVDVRFPRAAETTEPPTSTASMRMRAAKGTETILVVEDEQQVRELALRILRRAGYRVISAADPAEALAACERGPGPIHLLLTDLVLPQINGRELATHVRAIHPAVSVVYMSGYAGGAVPDQQALDDDAAFVEKPFTPERLARAVREALDRER